MFPSGYPDVYATFPSRDNYSQFIELILPIALWRVIHEGWRSWWYLPVAGVLFASVVGSASRMGTALCVIELLVMLGLGLLKFRDAESGLPARSTAVTLLLVPIIAVIFTFAVGWETVWLRFQDRDPYLDRAAFAAAAIQMAKQQPLTGFGLDTFPLVYPAYAIKDMPLIVNHAHNDWAEFAADGGVPLLLLVFISFAAAVPASIRNPWGLGLIAIMLHACVDYPFPRAAVSGWIFAMLGLVYMAGSQNGKISRAISTTGTVVLPPARTPYSPEQRRPGPELVPRETNASSRVIEFTPLSGTSETPRTSRTPDRTS